MSELSFVTTCRGRLAQLRQTLPRLVRQHVPVIVVDYDCPDKCGNWVADFAPSVQVVRSGPRPHMNLNEARNLGLKEVQTPVAMMIDCDVMVEEGMLLTYAAQVSYARKYMTVRQPRKSLSGTAMFRMSDYRDVCGYDEVLNRFGIGYDELDYYQRLERMGVRLTYFETDTLTHLDHEGRADHCHMNNRKLSDRLNLLYFTIKHDILNTMTEHTNELDYEYRGAIMERVYTMFIGAVLTGERTVLELELSDRPMGGMVLRNKLKYELDAREILDWCQLTIPEVRAIVERCNKVHGVSVAS